MPNYRYKDKDTDKEHDITLSITEWEELLEQNPNYQWVPVNGLPQVDPVKIGRKKPDDGFRDVLRTIKKGNRHSRINTF